MLDVAKRHGCVVAVFVLSVAVSPARAEDSAGLALYDEADGLLKSGKTAEACDKFAASQRELPRAVTLLKLADCYDRIGKTASAWSTFREARLAAMNAKTLTGANKAKEEARITEADKRIGALEPKLNRARVVVKSKLPGLVVKRDGQPLSDGTFGVALPIDPGRHVFEATAPNAKPWKFALTIEGEAKTSEVIVPKLAVTEQPSADGSPATIASPGSTQRAFGYALTGVGLITMGVGSYYAYTGHYDATHQNWDGDNGICAANCEQRLADGKRTRSLGIGIGAGGVLVTVGGLALWLTAPTPDSAVQVGVTPNGLLFQGRF